MPKCRKCPAEIVFAKTEGGKWMPLESRAINVFVVGDDKVARMVVGYEPHWPNCPGATELRKPRQLSLVPEDGDA